MIFSKISRMKQPQLIALAAASVLAGVGVPAVAQEKPNVIIVIADDLGCGDVSAYGGSLKTPNFDRLAREGLRFTRGYAASATSSPSRYGLLTGVYPWRKNVNILPGDSPLIIPTDKPTMATMFRERGYATCAIGKWHLGLGRGNSDWNKKISPGPSEIGFDHSFIMAATNDRVPCVYFSNGYVVNRDPADPIFVSYRKNFPGEPTGRTHPHLLKQQPAPNHGHADAVVNGVSRIGFMKGGEKARWVDEEMANVFAREAHDFIRKNKNRPFFMYYALHQPHVPRVPNPKFAGKSGLGPRGDVILEADAQLGELLDLLKAENLDRKTLIVFTSDNGPVLNDGYADGAEEFATEKKYRPAGTLRGGKYSLFEGGTRVPFVVRWQGRVKPGVSDVPVSQLDLFASFADLVGGNVPRDTDSEIHTDVFLGKNKKAGRKNFVVEATGRLAYREGDFVYIPARPKLPPVAWLTKIENGNAKVDALYNIAADPAQQKNLAEAQPKKLKQMRERFLKITRQKASKK